MLSTDTNQSKIGLHCCNGGLVGTSTRDRTVGDVIAHMSRTSSSISFLTRTFGLGGIPSRILPSLMYKNKFRRGHPRRETHLYFRRFQLPPRRSLENRCSYLQRRRTFSAHYSIIQEKSLFYSKVMNSECSLLVFCDQHIIMFSRVVPG